VRCPPNGVLPDEWIMSDQETTDNRIERLDKKSNYLLKIPLLDIALGLFGKGLGDMFVALIDGNMSYAEVSSLHGVTLFGMPVILIDLVCIALGVALGTWTWGLTADDN
jgi:hypothetical protein